ncbi:MAG: HlyD family efflux transporter periplasmic adaptor subunit [Lachnospiraceae bacterium]|nr:HlyD family efflux transporter periplasmic adaptor subunit [Lachnospiraceae bacterium]
MQEKKSRKEWIKTIAIIFLSIMLVLTFFANTIRNYSLPEVAVQYVTSDTLSSKIRGTGTVASQDPYSVVWKQSRKIDSVRVRVGDEVEKGQVIYVLEEGESEEVKKAQQELESLQAAYEKALITGQVSTSDRKAVESGRTGTIEQKQAKIDAAQKKVDQYENEIKTLEAEINRWTYNPNGDIQEIKNVNDCNQALVAWGIEKAARDEQVKAPKEKYTAAEAAYEAQKNKVDDILDGTVSDNDVSGQIELRDSLKNERDAAKAIYDEKQKMCDIADSQIVQLTYTRDANKQVVDNKKKELNDKLELAKANKANAETALSELVTGITNQIDLETSLSAIHAKEEEIEKLKSDQGANEITAPVSGTILSLSRSAGETTTAEETVATIQVAGKGFTMSMTVTNEQAAMINKGDEAEVGNSWFYSDVHAKVNSIKPDKESQGKNKIIEFDLEGSVTSGTQLSLVITSRKSSNYDAVVPNSAIREDNNGKYVYRLISKPSPLGTRYSVERVNVTVIAEDDTRSAVSGPLEGWDSVITTFSKPLSDGMLVRLKQ